MIMYVTPLINRYDVQSISPRHGNGSKPRPREGEKKPQPPRSKGPRGACCGKPAGVRAPGRAGPDRGCPRRPPPPSPAPGPACTASALPGSPPPGAGRGAEGSEASISDPGLLRDEAPGAARQPAPAVPVPLGWASPGMRSVKLLRVPPARARLPGRLPGPRSQESRLKRRVWAGGGAASSRLKCSPPLAARSTERKGRGRTAQRGSGVRGARTRPSLR